MTASKVLYPITKVKSLLEARNDFIDLINKYGINEVRSKEYQISFNNEKINFVIHPEKISDNNVHLYLHYNNSEYNNLSKETKTMFDSELQIFMEP